MDSNEDKVIKEFIDKNIKLREFMQENDLDLLDLMVCINEDFSCDFSDSIISTDNIFKIDNGVLTINRDPSLEVDIEAFRELKLAGAFIFNKNLELITQLLKDKSIFPKYNIVELEESSGKFFTRLLLSEALLQAHLDYNNPKSE